MNLLYRFLAFPSNILRFGPHSAGPAAEFPRCCFLPSPLKRCRYSDRRQCYTENTGVNEVRGQAAWVWVLPPPLPGPPDLSHLKLPFLRNGSSGSAYLKECVRTETSHACKLLTRAFSKIKHSKMSSVVVPVNWLWRSSGTQDNLLWEILVEACVLLCSLYIGVGHGRILFSLFPWISSLGLQKADIFLG